MKTLCVVWIWIVASAGLGAAEDIIIHGYSGDNVTVTCSHKWASDNIKYFCRDPCSYNTGVLVSSGHLIKDRFKLEDLGRGVFTVTISDLQMSDSGIYWCGVRRSPIDTYNKVQLIVSTDTRTVDPHESITTATQAHKEEEQTSGDFYSSASSDSESPSTTAITTARSSLHDRLRRSDSVSLHTSLYNIGLPIIAAIVLLAGLVIVHQYSTRVETAEKQTSDKKSTERSEEDTQNNTDTKSKEKADINTKTISIYQNLDLSMSQSNEIYESI